MREAERRGEDLGPSDDESAFPDALETNDSAVNVLGSAALARLLLLRQISPRYLRSVVVGRAEQPPVALLRGLGS